MTIQRIPHVARLLAFVTVIFLISGAFEAAFAQRIVTAATTASFRVVAPIGVDSGDLLLLSNLVGGQFPGSEDVWNGEFERTEASRHATPPRGLGLEDATFQLTFDAGSGEFSIDEKLFLWDLKHDANGIGFSTTESLSNVLFLVLTNH